MGNAQRPSPTIQKYPTKDIPTYKVPNRWPKYSPYRWKDRQGDSNTAQGLTLTFWAGCPKDSQLAKSGVPPPKFGGPPILLQFHANFNNNVIPTCLPC